MEVASLRRRQWTLLSLKPAKLDAACAEAKTAARHSSQAFHDASSERESLPAELHFAVSSCTCKTESCVVCDTYWDTPLAYLEVLLLHARLHTWRCAVRWAGIDLIIDLMNKYIIILSISVIHIFIYAVFPIYVTCCVCAVLLNPHTHLTTTNQVLVLCACVTLCACDCDK